ncbi:hypothetical protein [Actinomadura decatromicini]|nr:hypothetical protein [Actinomadura decatromicini]
MAAEDSVVPRPSGETAEPAIRRCAARRGLAVGTFVPDFEAGRP